MKKLLAAIGFFTRTPVWRLCEIPQEKYKRVVDLWSVTGWLTGGVTAFTLWLALMVLPPLVAVICAFTVRLLFTGALHEDGFADFIDGFGGGDNRQRILEIMKDSHIGSYGVIGLIVYFLFLISCVASLPANLAPAIILCADPWSKFCGSFLINTLPYARKAEEAKNKLIYDRMSPAAFLISLFFGVFPILFFTFIVDLLPVAYLLCICLPMITAAMMIVYMRYKIQGYTGDCCGATAIICELTFYLSAAAVTLL